MVLASEALAISVLDGLEIDRVDPHLHRGHLSFTLSF